MAGWLPPPGQGASCNTPKKARKWPPPMLCLLLRLLLLPPLLALLPPRLRLPLLRSLGPSLSEDFCLLLLLLLLLL